MPSLVGSEMCIRDSQSTKYQTKIKPTKPTIYQLYLWRESISVELPYVPQPSRVRLSQKARLHPPHCLLISLEVLSVPGGAGGTGGGRTHLLLALVIGPLTTHPLRDGAPPLLLIETPPTLGRSLRLYHMLHRKLLLILPPSCFAVCRHHLSPRGCLLYTSPSPRD